MRRPLLLLPPRAMQRMRWWRRARRRAARARTRAGCAFKCATRASAWSPVRDACSACCPAMLFSFPRPLNSCVHPRMMCPARLANLERIFQPFVQAEQVIMRQFGGTGLGLTVTRRHAVAIRCV